MPPPRCQAESSKGQPTSISIHPGVDAVVVSTIAERAPSTEVTGKRLIEVVRAIGRHRLRRLLRLVAYPSQIMIEQPGNELVAEDGLDGRIAD